MNRSSITLSVLLFLTPVLGITLDAHGESEFKIGESLVIEQGREVDNVVTIGGPLTVFGVVKENAVAIGGDLILKPSAYVDGSAVSIGGEVLKDAGATVRGDIVEVSAGVGMDSLRQLMSRGLFPPEVGELAKAVRTIFKALYWIITTVVALALGALLVTFLPKHVEAISLAIDRNYWKSGLIGFLGVLCIVPLIVLTAITIIGIPLIPVIAIAVAVSMFLGYISVGLLIGKKIPLDIAERSVLVRLAIGIGLLALANLVPAFGWIVFAVANILGFGAVLISRFGTLGS